MNKWSLLLFSVLGLLLLTTTEPNFVDGRTGCSYRSSHTLLSDTRLSIYEPYCAFNNFAEISQLTLPNGDTRYVTKNVALKRSSRSDSLRRQFEDSRISSDERFRVLNNVGVELEDSVLAKSRDKNGLRIKNDLQFRRNFKFVSREILRDNHVDQIRSRNNDLFNKMEHDSRKGGINIREELLETRDEGFRRHDRLSSNLKDRKRERFTRQTFVIKTNIMPNQRRNIVEKRFRLIQNNEGKTVMERSNIDINTRRHLFRDARLTSDLLRNNDRRFKNDDRRSNDRLLARDGSTPQLYKRESLKDIRRNTDMDRKINVQRQSYDEIISKEIVARNNNRNVVIRDQNKRFTRLDKVFSRPGTIQRESLGLENRIRDDKIQIINGNEMRLFEQRHFTRRLSRQDSNINRHQELRQATLYIGRNIEDGEDFSYVLRQRTDGAFDQSRNRKIRVNNREMRIEENMAERVSLRNHKSVVEKRAVGLNTNKRRNEVIRLTVLEDRKRENILEQRRIKEFRNKYDEDNSRAARNTQRRINRNDIRQIYGDDNVFDGLLGSVNNDRKLISRLERERLTRSGKDSSQIRTTQRESQNRMHNDDIRKMNIQDNRLRDDPSYNRRLVSSRMVDKREARTYDEKLDNEYREQFRNSLARRSERALDERKIRQIRDKDEYILNAERTIERVVTQIDSNRKNVVGKAFLDSSTRINRVYRTVTRGVSELKHRENYDVRYRTGHENEKNFDQRRTRNMGERREDDIRNERVALRNLGRRNSMNNAMLNMYRRLNYDENQSEVILVRNNNRDIIKRSEREKENCFVNKRLCNLRSIRENQNKRLQNDNRQPMNIQENRLRKQSNFNRRLASCDSDINTFIEDRRTRTVDEKLNRRHDFRNMLSSEIERAFDESRTRHLQESRENMLKEKLKAERLLVRNINNIIEKRESRIRGHFDVNRQNKNTKRTLILLQLRQKDDTSLRRPTDRDFEQSRNGLVRNRRVLMRNEDNISNNRIAEIRGLRYINVGPNTRHTRSIVIPEYVETKEEFHDYDDNHRERRTEGAIRNIAGYEMDRSTRRMRISLRTTNNRDLLEARSEKQRHIDRENNDYVRINDRDNRERKTQNKVRDIRVSNRLQMSKDSRLAQTRTNVEEREIRTAFSKIQYLPNNQIFKFNLQYIFYLLQGLYILGLFPIFAKSSKGIQETTGFTNWFTGFCPQH